MKIVHFKRSHRNLTSSKASISSINIFLAPHSGTFASLRLLLTRLHLLNLPVAGTHSSNDVEHIGVVSCIVLRRCASLCFVVLRCASLALLNTLVEHIAQQLTRRWVTLQKTLLVAFHPTTQLGRATSVAWLCGKLMKMCGVPTYCTYVWNSTHAHIHKDNMLGEKKAFRVRYEHLSWISLSG